jgi:hypothetical protein
METLEHVVEARIRWISKNLLAPSSHYVEQCSSFLFQPSRQTRHPEEFQLLDLASHSSECSRHKSRRGPQDGSLQTDLCPMLVREENVPSSQYIYKLYFRTETCLIWRWVLQQLHKNVSTWKSALSYIERKFWFRCPWFRSIFCLLVASSALNSDIT